VGRRTLAGVRIRLAVGISLVLITTALVTPNAAGDPVRCYPMSDLFPDGLTRLRGDVDGDRRLDTVTTEARWFAGDACCTRLVVETEHGVFERRVDPLSGMLIAPPGLAALVKLDRSPGLEIAVVIWRGASTAFLDVYGVRGKRLTRVSADAFAYAGSVVNRSGVDCARNVARSWSPQTQRSSSMTSVTTSAGSSTACVPASCGLCRA
jgi:hypothetical protein